MGPIQSAIAALKPQRVHIDCQLWFSHPSTGSHIDIGYTSSDQAIIQRQVESCKTVFAPAEIDLVADWYGSSHQPSNNACITLREQSEISGTRFSICIDHGATGLTGLNPRIALNSLVISLRDNFFHSSAYAKYNGKYLLWEFNLASIKGLDLSAFEKSNPDIMLLHENQGVNSYAWPNGFAPSSPVAYLSGYMRQATSGLMIPCLWKGFDDHKKSDATQSVWGGPARKMDSGPSGWNLWNSLASLIQASGKQFTDIGIATLDDYEERTRLEPFILQEWASDVASQAQVLQIKAQQLTNVYDALLRAN